MHVCAADNTICTNKAQSLDASFVQPKVKNKRGHREDADARTHARLPAHGPAGLLDQHSELRISTHTHLLQQLLRFGRHGNGPGMLLR